MSDVHDRPTPFLLVDTDVLDANIAAMAAHTDRLGVALRPHAKTHKSGDIARRQLDAGATGLTVATVGEAERFVAAGCEDVFVAYPLWVDAAKGERLRRVASRAALSVGVYSVEGARTLAAQLPGCAVLVEVDSGHHRTGVPPAHAGELAEGAVRAGLDVRGVFTFPGHSYAPGAPADVAAQEAATLAEAAASLRAHGVEPRVVSGGSTPTAGIAHADVLTELRPGGYVFNDAQQWELGTVAPDRIALSCVATVVSHGEDRIVVDAGTKMLGGDRQPWSAGWGRLRDHPGAHLTLLSEHHGVIGWDGSPKPPLGSRLRVVPNHCCVAVNLVDELVTTAGGSWPVIARGANA